MTNALTTVARKAHPAADDLLHIVHINEQIKRVVGVSFKINIMALNAIFLAKRAGTAALGFGVLSNELRVFSQDLRVCMASLTELIHACVNEVSIVLQDTRLTRLLVQATGQSTQKAAVGRVLHDRQQANEAQVEKLTPLRRRLKRALEEAFQIVELGGVLAKSAKIEAAYGQSFAPALSQVSGEFDSVVEEIRVSLESLRRSTFFAGQ